MKHQQSALPLESGRHVRYCIERRGKRRLVKEMLRQRLLARRWWLRVMAAGAVAGTLATLASLVQYVQGSALP